VCGAGGGGCIFFFGRPSDMPAVRAAVASSGARVLDYRVEVEGLRVE
jgi:galactokinase/mevalonate kinase-like predicted kinase